MLEIRRHLDASAINPILNHPDVRPWLTEAGQDGDLNLSRLVSDRRNFLLMCEGGGIFFHQLEPGIYEAHTQFLPSVRGSIALAVTNQAIRWMFTRTDCMELLSKVPANNIRADAWAKLSGGTLDFVRPDAWLAKTGRVAIHFYALRYHDWVRQARGLGERGEWFHDRLNAEKQRLSQKSPSHADDPAHDRHVGAAVEMILGGQPEKGVILYNRWAKFAGYAPVSIPSFDPLVIDIADCLVRVAGESFEVLPCQ